jgi:hypothetical protein
MNYAVIYCVVIKIKLISLFIAQFVAHIIQKHCFISLALLYRKHYSEGQTENVLQHQSCSAAETDLADEPDEFSRQDEAAFLLKLKAGH